MKSRTSSLPEAEAAPAQGEDPQQQDGDSGESETPADLLQKLRTIDDERAALRVDLERERSSAAEAKRDGAILRALSEKDHGCSRPDVVGREWVRLGYVTADEDGQPVYSVDGRVVSVDELITISKDLYPELFRSSGGDGRGSPPAAPARPPDPFEDLRGKLAALR